MGLEEDKHFWSDDIKCDTEVWPEEHTFPVSAQLPRKQRHSQDSNDPNTNKMNQIVFNLKKKPCV